MNAIILFCNQKSRNRKRFSTLTLKTVLLLYVECKTVIKRTQIIILREKTRV